MSRMVRILSVHILPVLVTHNALHSASNTCVGKYQAGVQEDDFDWGGTKWHAERAEIFLLDRTQF